MKYKILFLFLMVLVLASNVSAAQSDDVGIIGDKVFTVPEDFEIINITNQYAFLESSDKNQTIVIMVRDTDPDKLFGMYERAGYEFNGTFDTYQRGIYHVNETSFTYQDYIGLYFACDNGDDRVYILHSFLNEDDFPDGKDKLILELISSLQDNY